MLLNFFQWIKYGMVLKKEELNIEKKVYHNGNITKKKKNSNNLYINIYIY